MTSEGYADPVDVRIARIESEVERLIGRWQPEAEAERLHRDAGAEWSVIKGLVHVVEFLPYWARAAQGVAGRDDPGSGFGRTHHDVDRIAWIEEHADDLLPAVLRDLRRAAADAVATLRSIPHDAWDRRGLHASRGEMSVFQIVDQFMIDHIVDHAAQADAALEAVE
jgi:uncharacterized damage-inducible protein DinB